MAEAWQKCEKYDLIGLAASSENKDQSGGAPLWLIQWVRKIEKLAVGTIPFRQDLLAGRPGQRARSGGRVFMLQRAGCAEGRR